MVAAIYFNIAELVMYLDSFIIDESDCDNNFKYTREYLVYNFDNEKERILNLLKQAGYKCDCDILLKNVHILK